jgi:hypothetical protein
MYKYRYLHIIYQIKYVVGTYLFLKYLRIYPSKTFLIILLSVLSPSMFLWLTIHFDEHRYCSNGIRYLPQKSTNLMCSTLSSKNTPAKVNKNVTLQF